MLNNKTSQQFTKCNLIAKITRKTGRNKPLAKNTVCTVLEQLVICLFKTITDINKIISICNKYHFYKLEQLLSFNMINTISDTKIQMKLFNKKLENISLIDARKALVSDNIEYIPEDILKKLITKESELSNAQLCKSKKKIVVRINYDQDYYSDCCQRIHVPVIIPLTPKLEEIYKSFTLELEKVREKDKYGRIRDHHELFTFFLDKKNLELPRKLVNMIERYEKEIRQMAYRFDAIEILTFEEFNKLCYEW